MPKRHQSTAHPKRLATLVKAKLDACREFKALSNTRGRHEEKNDLFNKVLQLAYEIDALIAKD